VQDIPKVESAPESELKPLSSTVLSAVGLAPSADGDAPELPGESPLLLAGLAASRRQTQQALVGDEALTKTSAEPSQSSLMLAAAVANSAPTAVPVVGSPDQVTGAVQVSLHASDADGNSLSYAMTGVPTGGSVEVLGNGEFRYTPTATSRLAAASTSTPDFDSFTVSVSDGQGGVTPVNISVPKLPAVWANQSSSSNQTGASPYGVALVGDLAYVANQGTNTVTVVNTKTGAVVGNPIQVGTAPTGVLANADGSKVYVTNRTSGTVSVIRTSDRSVTSVTVGTNPEFMALNDTGTRLYVTNYGSSSVSVIDTATNKLIDVNPATPTTVDAIKVGAYPRGIAFTTVKRQPRLYVVSQAGNSVSVVDANTYKLIDANPATPTTVDSIKVGSTPEMIAIRDGYAYVTNNGSSTVSVINVATNKVEGAAISVGTKPAGVTFSGDGSLLYVANGNDTVSVINTKTRALVSTLQVDTAPETNYHIIAVRSDGSLVVTDMADKAVRVVQLKRGNTAPVAIGNPGVGDANLTNGAVSGLINLKDWDGDLLNYSAVSAPTKGSLTFDAATGTYTYTPTQAARDAAAQTPATDRFTIRATDPSGAYKDTTPITITILPSVISGQTTAAIRSADPLTGEVRGPLGVSGSGLSYTVVSAPTKGTVTVTPQGEYVYKPTLAARLAADLTTGADTDGFTVRVSGAQTSTTVTVTAPVSPARVTVDSQLAPSLGNAPAGVDMNYRRAWVVNQADGTMSIIEVPGGYPVVTLPVGASPRSIAFDDAYAWVTNQGSNTVSVIDLVYNPGSTVTVSGFNQPWDVVTDYPGLVFVSNKGNGIVSVIHPQTKQVLRTFQVGQGPTEMALTGTHLYVANSGSNSVSMINLDTNTVSASIPVGTNPTGLAVSPDGKWVYVTNQGSNTVSVINAATNTIVGSPIAVGSQPTSVLVSPDSSLAYVANSDDTVSVIDIRTNTVVRTVAIDPNPEIGSHSLALSQGYSYPYRDDDRIYVTDGADRTMRALAITPSPATQLPATTTPVTVGNTPGNVAVVGNYAYVVNAGSNTVSRIDTTTNTVVGAPITVGSWATAVAASPAAHRVYVADFYDNKVYAIDTNTNAVVDSYDVPVQQYEYAEWWNGLTGVKVSRDGRRLYAVATDGSITAIDTASRSVVGTAAAGSDMEVSADGSLLYVTGGEAIAVYNTTSMAKVGEIHVGPYQFDGSRQMAINADGTRAYVTTGVVVVESTESYFNGEDVIRDSSGNLWRVVGRYDAVSVIDISTRQAPRTTLKSRVSPLLAAQEMWQSAQMATAST
jgi:YVTN family beta-propeller protein/VCBS repeat-containing protein